MENGKRPDDNELLAFLDGELTPERQAEIRQQLEADWELRARLNRLEQRVLDYVNATAHHSLTDLPPFDDFWQGISARLSDAAAADSAPSARAKRPLLRRVSDSFERVMENRRLRLAFGASFGLLAILFVSLLVFRTEQRVSAHELLQRTRQAETQRLRAIAEPVVYQKIRVSRRSASSGGEEAILWESWNEPNGGRFRQRVADARGLRFVREGEADKSELLSELEQVFRDNQLDLRRPLSAAAFAEWRAAVQPLAESVTEVSLPGGGAAAGLKLTTTVKGAERPNSIIESSLVVRVADWHAVARLFRVRKDNEIREYELSETAWEALPAQALAIFEEVAPPPPVASLSPAPAVKPSIVASSPSPAPPPPPSEAELKESEVAALYALHQLKADLGEPLEIIRAAGQVIVRGQVETTERKRELSAAMNAIPFVAARIQTFDEAAAQSARAQPPATVAVTDSSGVSTSAPGVNQFERRLARYFAERNNAAPQNPEATSRRIAQLANDVFAESSAALTSAWALRRLAERFNESFNESRDEPLSAEAAARLREIIGNHLAEIRVRHHNLRARLEPALIFVAGERATAVPSTEISEATRKARVMRLFRAAEQVHQLTYRLFDSGSSFAASPEQAALQTLQALAQLDAALPALEQDVRK